MKEMEEKGVKRITTLIQSGINQSGIMEPDNTLINTFLIVMMLHTLISQKESICVAKLIVHKTPYPNNALSKNRSSIKGPAGAAIPMKITDTATAGTKWNNS